MNEKINLLKNNKTLDSIKSYFIELKDKSNTIFYDLINGFTEISKKTEYFLSIMTPYINYFYKHNHNDENNFINEVVKGTEYEMISNLEAVVKNLMDDKKVNKEVQNAIEKTLSLNNSLELILDIVDSIDLYAKNTMIISIKAGEEGSTLTTIAEQMSHLSEMVNVISNDFTNIIKELNSSRSQYIDIFNKINFLLENNLNKMQEIISQTIQSIESQQKVTANIISKIEGFFNKLNDITKKIIIAVQIQDIVRQDIEKIIFSIEALDESFYTQTKSILYNSLIKKIESLSNTFKNLYETSLNGLTELQVVTTNISEEYNAIKTSNSHFALDSVFASLESLKNDVISDLNNVLKLKDSLLNISNKVIQKLMSFESFFNQIQDIIKKFDVINMLTRIELARHQQIKKTIASSLLDISALPKKIKQVVDTSSKIYNDVLSTMIESNTKFQEAYNNQNMIINNNIKSIENLTKKIHGSKELYNNMNNQINSSLESLEHFLDIKIDEIANLKNIEDEIYENYKKLSSISDIDEYIPSDELEISRVIDIIKEKYNNNNYKGMMLISLIREYFYEKQEENVIIF